MIATTCIPYHGTVPRIWKPALQQSLEDTCLEPSKSRPAVSHHHQDYPIVVSELVVKMIFQYLRNNAFLVRH